MPLQTHIQRAACTAVPDFIEGLLGQLAVAAHTSTHQLAWEAIRAYHTGAQLYLGLCCPASLSSSSLEAQHNVVTAAEHCPPLVPCLFCPDLTVTMLLLGNVPRLFLLVLCRDLPNLMHNPFLV